MTKLANLSDWKHLSSRAGETFNLDASRRIYGVYACCDPIFSNVLFVIFFLRPWITPERVGGVTPPLESLTVEAYIISFGHKIERLCPSL